MDQGGQPLEPPDLPGSSYSDQRQTKSRLSARKLPVRSALPRL